MTSKLSQYCFIFITFFFLPACKEDSSSSANIERLSDTVKPLANGELSISFEDVSVQSGLAAYTHGLAIFPREKDIMAVGLAVEDIDNDGDEDLYLSRGSDGYNVLLENSAADLLALNQLSENAGFNDVTADYNLPTGVNGEDMAIPFFLDLDGDTDMDLLLGGVSSSASNNVQVYKQDNNQLFQLDLSSGLSTPLHIYSFSAADYDKDLDLDIFMAHWGELNNNSHMLWAQDNNTFSDISNNAGLSEAYSTLEYKNYSGQVIVGPAQFNFSPNFADMNNDGWLDLVIAGDFATSKYLLSVPDSTTPDLRRFVEQNAIVLDDENGMGAAVGDYDNDGDLDWFVSSIYDPNGIAEGNWGVTGNRLYQNDGTGLLSEVSADTGVRQGYWGWGACFADFNNDGHLDLFHVNGMGIAGQTPVFNEFVTDASRLFMADGHQGFIESSSALGIEDTRQGRGVSCFDYDLDGDLDILIINSGQAPRLYRNNSDGSMTHHYLSIRLKGDGQNSQGIGARIYVTNPAPAGNLPKQQMRELRAGTNFASQDPAIAHFGLGQATTVDVRVVWPDDAADTICTGISSGQRIWLSHPNQTSGSGCP